MRFQLAVLFLTLGSAGASARAQILPEGTRVRASIPPISERTVYGRVLVLSADSLQLRQVHGYTDAGVYFAPRISIARTAVTQLEYSRGRDRWRGARIGALVGLLVPVVALYSVEAEDRGLALYYTPYVGAVTITTFAGLGALLGPERWEKVLPWP